MSDTFELEDVRSLPASTADSYVMASIAISLKRIADGLDSVISGSPESIKELNVHANCDVRSC